MQLAFSCVLFWKKKKNKNGGVSGRLEMSYKDAYISILKLRDFFGDYLLLSNLVISVSFLSDFKLEVVIPRSSVLVLVVTGVFCFKHKVELNDAGKHFKSISTNSCMYFKPQREIIVQLGSTGILCSRKLGQWQTRCTLRMYLNE